MVLDLDAINANNERHMRECLDLARLAEGRTRPNPLVGAVVLDRHGLPVGRGYHQRAGQKHAEPIALAEAGERAQGGTLYVNLEPCCHHGRTPPCSDAVIASGVAKVIIGMEDPDEKVNGGGIKALRERGIEVEVGVLEKECRWLNRGFIKRITFGMPWTILKIAATLDGRIADRAGKSRWISGPQAQKFVHELRNRVDCVIVGGRTARKDDPQLNVREIEDSRDPVRVIVDPSLELPLEARLFRSVSAAGAEASGSGSGATGSGGSGGAPNSDASVIVFCSHGARRSRGHIYETERGEDFLPVQVIGLDEVPPDTEAGAGATSMRSAGLDLNRMMQVLSRQGMNMALCEGGGRLAGALLERGLVDEINWIVAPKLLCDASSVPAVTGRKFRNISESIELFGLKAESLGEDILLRAVIDRSWHADG